MNKTLDNHLKCVQVFNKFITEIILARNIYGTCVFYFNFLPHYQVCNNKRCRYSNMKSQSKLGYNFTANIEEQSFYYKDNKQYVFMKHYASRCAEIQLR